MSMTFEDRMKAAGLTVKPGDLPKLAALVKDLDRTAALVNTPRCYAEEPLSVFKPLPVPRRSI
jgi:hypothetical protein